MNIKNLELIDKFRAFVNENGGIQQVENESSRLYCILAAENMEVCDLIHRAKNMVLIGFKGNNRQDRPVIFETTDLSGKVCWFPKTDLADDIVFLQDEIDIVASVKREFGVILTERDDCNLEESFDTVVYGRGIMKGGKLSPHLTVAEVISQIGADEEEPKAFCIVSGAKKVEYLTDFGYFAYDVKVFTAEYPAEITRCMPTVLGYNSADIDMI